MRMRMLGVVAAIGMCASAWAEVPAPKQPSAGPAGAAWDDSHMQSRYQETGRVQRPRLSGQSSYGALASGGAESSGNVKEQLEFTSQREWAQGPLSTGSVAKAQAAESAAQSERSTPIQRNSTLRSGAVRSSGRGF
jgi:hypothetical protein